jgi:hypothetical protein
MSYSALLILGGKRAGFLSLGASVVVLLPNWLSDLALFHALVVGLVVIAALAVEQGLYENGLHLVKSRCLFGARGFRGVCL